MVANAEGGDDAGKSQEEGRGYVGEELANRKFLLAKHWPIGGGHEEVTPGCHPAPPSFAIGFWL